MSIYKNIPDGLYLEIHNEIMDVLNPYDDDDNVSRCRYDEENRRFEIEMLINDKSYNKTLFDGLKPRFNGWDINPFRKMEFSNEGELQTIYLYLKAETTLKKVWNNEREQDYQTAQQIGERLIRERQAEQQAEERRRYEEAKKLLPTLEKELEDITTGKITLKPVKKWKRLQYLESEIGWNKEIISKFDNKNI